MVHKSLLVNTSALDSNGACDLNGFGLDVSQSHSASVTIPSMGRAYFDPAVKQVYDAADDVYTFDGNVFSFVATIDSISPAAISDSQIRNVNRNDIPELFANP